MRQEFELRQQIDELNSDIQRFQEMYDKDEITYEELLEGQELYRGYIECFEFALGESDAYGTWPSFYTDDETK